MLAPATEDAAQFVSDRQLQQLHDAMDADEAELDARRCEVTLDDVLEKLATLPAPDAADLMLAFRADRRRFLRLIDNRFEASIEAVASGKRFARVMCASCGRMFGPGNAGYSHCSDHN